MDYLFSSFKTEQLFFGPFQLKNNTYYLRSIFSGWSAVSANLLVSFLITPLIVAKLGDAQYGIWSLITTMVGYLGLADVGFRRSIQKYLNQYLAHNDSRSAKQIVSTSLAILLAISIIVITLSLIAGFFLNTLFPSIPKSMATSSRLVFFIIGFELSLGLLVSVFKQILTAFNRVDLVDFIVIIRLIIRTIGTIFVLSVSPDIVNLAIVSFVSLNIANFLLIYFSFKVWPELKLGIHYCKKVIAVELKNFGIPTFFDNVSVRITDYSALLIVGSLLTMKMVTIYSISLMMINYTQEFVKKIIIIMTPSLFKETSLNNKTNVISLFFKTANISAFLCIPLAIGFFTYGSDFIKLWIGHGYEESSILLSILSLVIVILPVKEISKIILLGYNIPTKVAYCSLIEAVISIGLAIILIKYFDLGVFGVAYASIIPSFFATIYLLIFACRKIELPIVSFLHKIIIKWVIGGFIFWFICQLSLSIFDADSWSAFGFIILGLSLCYVPVGFFCVLDSASRCVVLNLGLVRRICG